MSAASKLKVPTPTDIPATIYGWGRQVPTEVDTPIKQLKGLNVMIVACEPYFRTVFLEALHYPDGVNKWICISKPANVGGTCEGDSGGWPSLLLLTLQHVNVTRVSILPLHEVEVVEGACPMSQVQKCHPAVLHLFCMLITFARPQNVVALTALPPCCQGLFW